VARGEDLVLKITADTADVARGLAPMTKALGTLETEAEQASDALAHLDGTEVEISVQEQALRRARDRIDDLRNTIARDVVLGVDTRATEQELSRLQATVRRLTNPTTPHRVEVEVEVEADEAAMEGEISGLEALRSGAAETSLAFGELDGSMQGFAQLGLAAVPMMADFNETLVAARIQAEAAGRSVGRMGRAVQSLTGFVAGPWGIALMAGVALLSVWADSQDDAADAAEDFTDQLNYQTGALDENNRRLIAAELQKKGLLEDATKFGVSTRDLVSALLGETGAWDKVNAQIKTFREQTGGGREFAEFTDRIDLMGQGIDATGRSAAELERAVGDMGEAAADAGTELDNLVRSLDILNGRFVTTEQAQSDYEEGVDDLAARLADLKEAGDKSAYTLDKGTEAGRENSEMVREQADNIANLAEARLADAEASGGSTDQIVADYAAQRESLIVTADKLGMTRGEAEKYVDQLLATPKELQSEVSLTGTDEARDELTALTRKRTVEIEAQVSINIDAAVAQLRRGIGNATLRYEAGVPGNYAYTPPAAPAPTVFLQPRLFLDSRPLRGALRGDINDQVSATVAATQRRGRLG